MTVEQECQAFEDWYLLDDLAQDQRRLFVARRRHRDARLEVKAGTRAYQAARSVLREARNRLKLSQEVSRDARKEVEAIRLGIKARAVSE